MGFPRSTCARPTMPWRTSRCVASPMSRRCARRWLARVSRDGWTESIGISRRPPRGLGRGGGAALPRSGGARHRQRRAPAGSTDRADPKRHLLWRWASPFRGRSHRRGDRRRDPAAGRGDRGACDRPLPDLRQRWLPVGVRGHVARRSTPLVRHDLMRQPGQGPSIPVAPPECQPRWRAGRWLVPHAATLGVEWWTSALKRQGLAGRALRLCQRR